MLGFLRRRNIEHGIKNRDPQQSDRIRCKNSSEKGGERPAKSDCTASEVWLLQILEKNIWRRFSYE
jgi:hypothetical protein